MEKEIMTTTIEENVDVEVIEALDVVCEEEATPTEEKKKKSPAFKAAIAGLVAIFLAGAVFAGFMIFGGQRNINTGNARVTTNYVHITTMGGGLLERFNVYEGMIVEAGQMLGWVQHGESFRSPVNGIVVSVDAILGQDVMPMQPLITIADLNNLHIIANIYEDDVQDIILGQPVSVTLDGMRGQTFAGYVRSVGRITELELAGGAMQIGTFRRVAFTIPVEIAITDDIDLSQFLGTNARVTLPVFTE